MLTRLLISGMFLFFFTTPARAVWWATEWTQVLNNLELALQNINTVKGLYNDAIMIKNQVESLKSIASYKGDWQNIDSILAQIESARQRAEAVYNQVQGTYQRAREMYPELKKSGTEGQVLDSVNDMATSATEGAMEAADIQKKAMDQERAAVQGMLQKSDDAQGQTQAIQATNKLIAELIAQMQQLRELTNYQIAQTNAMIKKNDYEKKVHDDVEAVFHPYGGEKSNFVFDKGF